MARTKATTSAPLADLARMLTKNQVAAHWGVSLSTIDRMIARGELRAYHVGPRAVRIDPRDLDRARKQIAAPTYMHVSGGSDNA